VSRSTDGAQTFQEPILPTHVSRSGQFVDVTWITCDNFPNSPFYQVDLALNSISP
jgi:hypothetical protein